VPNSTSSVPPPRHLSLAQKRELEHELRRELATLERRLASEHQAEAAETGLVAAAYDAAVGSRRATDTSVRHDVVAAALARLAAGEYGACSRCGEPIPYGRLLVMPEATHCLSCSARS
jgi:DnaK suppressor protein